MCGIAGGISKTEHPLPEAILTTLQESLHHRGPDGRGAFAKGAVGLVHTRLAIIDPDHGVQPFVAPDGTALVGNGEIYNDLEIRAQLGQSLYQTGSDNESALHLFKKYGLDFTRHLRGMYALALYDPALNALILARDPFGIKPLYYLDAKDAVWFASEPQAFLKAGLIRPAEIDEVRDQLFGLQHTTGRQTIYKEIQRVLPGEVAVIQAGGSFESVRIDTWNVPGHRIQSGGSTEPVFNFARVWTNSIDLHRRSDVPYGLFLSSGTDSAAVLAAMAQLETKPVATFTAGFEGDGVHDERAHAQQMARLMGAEHTSLDVKACDFWETLPAITSALDDPVADYAVVPTYLLAKEASKSVKVVLTGEGGDELFAGYGRYRSGTRPWPFRKRSWARHILERSGVLRKNPGPWRVDLDTTERQVADASLTQLQKVQTLDISHWLPNDLLTKVDRCLMAHGVEGRVPFLDLPTANYGFQLPDNEKVKGRLGKYLLRRWLAETFPGARPFERKKGFSVPVGSWIASESDRLSPLIANQPGVAAACNPEAVRTMIRNVATDKALPAWLLLFYALWHQIHMQEVSPNGSVFDVLAERKT